MRPILANLIITSFPSNSLPSSTPPLNTPGSSPLLRPISSPMTPITPLVLSDSTTTGNGTHYEKENFFSHETGYFFHSHNEEELLYTTPPYCYTFNDRNTTTQPQFTVNINSPSPLSSGATTPNTQNTNSFNPNSAQTVNHYANYANHPHNQNVHHQMMSSYNNYTAPNIADYYNNQQFYMENTLENAYYHHHDNHDAKIQNQDDVQFHEIINGLNKMDIVDSH